MILKVTRSSLFAWILSVLIITAVFFTLKANGPDHQPSMFVSEIPDYEGMSDFDKVKAIRRWVYRNVDVAADEKSLIDSPYNLSLLTLDDIIRLVRKDVGGYWCGGVAYTLYKAYKEAGFRAWVYHYGFHSALTHATTLVEVRDKIYLQDAYFNLEFLNSQKEPLAFFEVLSGLTGRRVAGAVSDEDWRDVHRSDQGKRQADWTAYHQSEDTRCKLRDDQIGQTCQVRTSLEGFAILHPLMSKTREALEELGWPAEIDYLLLYPFALYSDEKGYITDPNQLLEFHQIFTITRRLGGVIPIMSLRSDN